MNVANERRLREIACNYEEKNECPKLPQHELLSDMILSIDYVVNLYGNDSTITPCVPFISSMAACARSLLEDKPITSKHPGIPWVALSRLAVIVQARFQYQQTNVVGGDFLEACARQQGLPIHENLVSIVVASLKSLKPTLETLVANDFFQQRVPILNEIRAIDDCVAFPLQRQIFEVVKKTLWQPPNNAQLRFPLTTSEDRMCFVRQLSVLGELFCTLPTGPQQDVEEAFKALRNASDHFENEFLDRDSEQRSTILWLKSFIADGFSDSLAAISLTAGAQTQTVAVAVYSIARDCGIIPHLPSSWTDAFLTQNDTLGANILQSISLDHLDEEVDWYQKAINYDKQFFLSKGSWTNFDKIQFVHEYRQLRSTFAVAQPTMVDAYNETKLFLVDIGIHSKSGAPLFNGFLNKRFPQQTVAELQFYTTLFGSDAAEVAGSEFRKQYDSVNAQRKYMERLRARQPLQQVPQPIQNTGTLTEATALVEQLIREIYEALRYSRRLALFRAKKSSPLDSDWLTLNEVYWTIEFEQAASQGSRCYGSYKAGEQPDASYIEKREDLTRCNYAGDPILYKVGTVARDGKFKLQANLSPIAWDRENREKSQDSVKKEMNSICLAIEHYTVIVGSYARALVENRAFVNEASPGLLSYLNQLRIARGYMAHNTVKHLGMGASMSDSSDVFHRNIKDMFLSLPHLIITSNRLLLRPIVDEAKKRCNDYLDAHNTYGSDYNVSIGADMMQKQLQLVQDHLQEMLHL